MAADAATDPRQLEHLAKQGLQQLRTMIRAGEGVLTEFDSQLALATEDDDELLSRADRLRELRLAYAAARDRLIVLIPTCDDSAKIEDARALDHVEPEAEELEALERRLEDLKDQAKKKNRVLKRMIDLLRDVSNDFVMWECCGKMSTTAK